MANALPCSVITWPVDGSMLNLIVSGVAGHPAVAWGGGGYCRNPACHTVTVPALPIVQQRFVTCQARSRRPDPAEMDSRQLCLNDKP